MFSSILSQASALFERRSLTNIFFPVLFFWGVLTAVLISEIGWAPLLDRWNKLSAVEQALFAIGFVGWAALWAFLAIAFRSQRIRLFEGYWPSEGWAGAPWRWRRRRWQAWMDQREARDDELAREQGAVADDESGWSSLATAYEADTEAGSPGTVGDQKLKELEAAAEGRSVTAASLERLRILKRSAQEVSAAIHSSGDNNANRRMQKIIDAVARDLGRRFLELKASRAALALDLFVYLPPGRQEVMPTRMGNVLKAAEAYGRERYGLDSVVVWPRLYPLLPGEVVDDFEDATASLDLMALLSVLMVTFGLPISVLLASGGALHLSIILRVLLGALLVAAFLFLGWVCYGGAVQAAVAYGEKIKAVIDLYRGALLKQLKIEQPASRRDERKLWMELCAFLYRGDAPTTRIVVPKKTLPVFVTVAPTDVEEALVEWSELPSGSVQSRNEIVGRAPIVTLPQGKPVPARVLVDRSAIDGHAGVTIRAQTGSRSASGLMAGDRVDIVLLPHSSPSGKAHDPHVFSNLLVLAVGEIAAQSDGEAGASAREVTLAVPMDRREDFIKKTQTAEVVVTMTLSSTSVGPPVAIPPSR